MTGSGAAALSVDELEHDFDAALEAMRQLLLQEGLTRRSGIRTSRQSATTPSTTTSGRGAMGGRTYTRVVGLDAQ